MSVRNGVEQIFYRPLFAMRRRAGQAEKGSAESDAPQAGSGRNGARISIRTRTGTHASLTSSRSRHVRLCRTIHTQAGAQENPKNSGNRTPLVRVSALHGVSGDSGSHLGSTLKPGGAVLTLGVSRRSGSVAYIRVDASPNEVLTPSMMPEHSARVNSPRRIDALTSRYGFRDPVGRSSPGRNPFMTSETMKSAASAAVMPSSVVSRRCAI